MIEIPRCSGKCFGRFQTATDDDTDDIGGGKHHNHSAGNPGGESGIDETTSPALYGAHFLDVRLSLTLGCMIKF
jgi:hypothetical protein